MRCYFLYICAILMVQEVLCYDIVSVVEDGLSVATYTEELQGGAR